MNSSLLCDVEACESYAWPVGTFGHCNVTTGVCECPPGFGGSYILSDSNDCHVSDAFKQTMNSVTFGVAVFAAVSAVVALAKVSLEIYLSCRPNVVPASSQSLQRESFMVRRFRPHKIVLARKLLMRRTLFGYVFHGLIEIYRASVLVNDTHVFVTEIPAQEALIYGLSLCASTTSVFAFLYIYFTSLPKGGQMAAVLGISHDTERYQRMLNWTFKYNTLLCNLLLAGVNIGYAANSSAWFVKNFMTLQMSCQTFVVVDLVIVSCFLYYMNVPVYKKIIKHSGNHKCVQKLRVAIFRCEICIYNGVPSLTCFGACLVLVASDERFNFIPFTFVAINVQLSMALGSYLLGWDFISMDRQLDLEDTKLSTSKYSYTDIKQ